jgi:apolipoprotein N-acyltransferase
MATTIDSQVTGEQAGTELKTQTAARVAIGLALSALTTAMLILAFPPFNVWPLAFFCLVPMLVAQYRVLPFRLSYLAPVIGGDLWVWWFVTTLFGLSPQMLFIQLVPIACIVIDFTSAKGTRRFHEQTGYRWFVPSGAFTWVGFEMLRSFVPLVRTYGFIAHTQHTQPWLIQPVSVLGMYALGLLIMLINYALAQGALALFDRRWQRGDLPRVGRRLVRGWLAGVGIALVAWVGISLAMVVSAPKDVPTIRVAAVRLDLSMPGHIDTAESQTSRLQSLSEQTRAAAQQGAQLVVWPELSVGFDPQVEHTAELRALAAETNAYLVIGYGRATGEESRNAAVTLTPAGEFLAISGKSHFPPGEPRDPDAAKYPIYDLTLGQLATIICHDANFTETGRILARKGAELISVPTYEASIPGLRRLFHVQTLFRALENRTATVAAGNYFSAIVDPFGRIIAKQIVEPGEGAAPLVADVSLGKHNALYSRLGEWVGWVALAGLIFFTVLPEVLKARAAKQKQ